MKKEFEYYAENQALLDNEAYMLWRRLENMYCELAMLQANIQLSEKALQRIEENRGIVTSTLNNFNYPNNSYGI